MKVVIVANAPDLDATPYTEQIAAAELRIAADGGALPLMRLGYLPHMVVGDLDSLSVADQQALIAEGVSLERHPRAKDETDLELALIRAVEAGATSIDILGALGGRWDHTLANVALMALPELKGLPVRLLADRQMLFLVRDTTELVGRKGDTISLLPLTAEVHGVTTRGLLYPLDNATLAYERARGISNVLLESPAQVNIRTGLLLVVQHDDGGAHQYAYRERDEQ